MTSFDRPLTAVHTPPHPTPVQQQASIECMNLMFTEETAEDVLSGSPDFVLDAIDNIDTKVRQAGCAHLNSHL